MSDERIPSAGSRRIWRTGSRDLLLDHPIVMGILNVTPDSFSDGGNFFSPSDALGHAERMVSEGADIIDVGGESTRPGAIPVEAAQESDRVVPMITEIRKRFPDLFISIDTTKADVASRALDAGADIVNDVSALRLDPAMPALVARSKCGVILMHSRGDVSNMASYEHAIYDDVVSEVLAELGSQLLLAEDAGVDRKAIVLDPGLGFAKKPHQSWELLHGLPRFTSYDVPVMIGVSRKRMLEQSIGPWLKDPDWHKRADSLGRIDLTVREKDDATAQVNALALELGASIFRVHDVAASRITLDKAWEKLQRAHTTRA
jgi:dihydropteroate synthase